MNDMINEKPELLRQMNMIPSRDFKNKVNKRLRLMLVLAIVADIVFLGVLVTLSAVDTLRLPLAVYVVVTAVMVIQWFVLLNLTGKFNKAIDRTDYVQDFEMAKFVIFMRYGKFGLINLKQYKVAVPAEYDSMAWCSPDNTLTVTRGGESFVINTDGKKL